MSTKEKNVSSDDRGHASHEARSDRAGKGKTPVNKAKRSKSSDLSKDSTTPAMESAATAYPASTPYYVWSNSQKAAVAPPPPPPTAKPPLPPSDQPSTSSSGRQHDPDYVAPRSSRANQHVDDPLGLQHNPARDRSRSPTLNLEERMNRLEQSSQDLAQSLAAQQQMFIDQLYAAYQPPQM